MMLLMMMMIMMMMVIIMKYKFTLGIRVLEFYRLLNRAF